MIFCPRTCLNANTKQPAVPLGAVQEVEKLKRNLLAAAATSSILALAAPSLALAQGNHHHHHHGARHASTHKRHGHGAHLLTFGGKLNTAPTTGPPSSGAATVVSFTEGVLTIELTSDKSLIKGKVTAQTKLECQPAPGTSQNSDDEGQQSGDDQDQSGGDDEGGPSGQTQDSGPVAHSSDVGDDQGEEQDQEKTCTTADLQPKAVVLRAELRIGDNGSAEWESIELQK